MRTSKFILVSFLALVIAAFFYFDLNAYLSFSYLKTQRESFEALYQNHPLASLAAYFLLYVLVTALSLPGAAILTLAGGLLFGVVAGTVVVSFASTIGATLAFLVARFLLRDFVQTKFKKRLKIMNEGIKKEGGFYLFSLRLIPAFPFFVINLAMGLTPLKTWQFFWVSQIGMLPGTIVYVNAGTQLGQVNNPSEIFTWELALSFAALGVVPFVAKKLIQWLRDRKEVCS